MEDFILIKFDIFLECRKINLLTFLNFYDLIYSYLA